MTRTDALVNSIMRSLSDYNIIYGGTCRLHPADFYDGNELIIYTEEPGMLDVVLGIVQFYFQNWNEHEHTITVIESCISVILDNDNLFIIVSSNIPNENPRIVVRDDCDIYVFSQYHTIYPIINNYLQDYVLNATLAERVLIANAVKGNHYSSDNDEATHVLNYITHDITTNAHQSFIIRDTVKDKFIKELKTSTVDLLPAVYGGTYRLNKYKGNTLSVFTDDVRFDEYCDYIDEFLSGESDIRFSRENSDKWLIYFPQTDEWLNLSAWSIQNLDDFYIDASLSDELAIEEVVYNILLKLIKYPTQVSRDEILFLVWQGTNDNLNTSLISSLFEFDLESKDYIYNIVKSALYQLGTDVISKNIDIYKSIC